MGQAARTLRRYVQNVNVERRAESLIKRTEEGGKGAAPAMADGDRRRLEQAAADPRLAEELSEKRPELVKRVDSITIRSTEPQTRSNFGRQHGLPTRETERWASLQPDPEYKIVEPPPDMIPKGKLSFREALQVLSAAVEQRLNPSDETAGKTLRQHPAIERIEQKSLENMIKYFQPFESIGEMVMQSETERLDVKEIAKGSEGRVDGELRELMPGRVRLIAQEKSEAVREYEATAAFLDRERVKLDRRARAQLGDESVYSKRPPLRGPDQLQLQKEALASGAAAATAAAAIGGQSAAGAVDADHAGGDRLGHEDTSDGELFSADSSSSSSSSSSSESDSDGPSEDVKQLDIEQFLRSRRAPLK